MYEKHIFPDGSRVFNRTSNDYVLGSDEAYQAWLNETELVFTYETQQQEFTETIWNEETGQEETITVVRDVQVAIPVMVTDEEGNEVQETRKIHTLRELVID